MNVETYTTELQKALGDNLCSVILYGSAAGTDFVAARSDLNLLVLCKTLGLGELKTAATASASWINSGQPWPLFLTRQALIESADVFPVEMLDIRESRRVLFGEDVPAVLEVSRNNLRHQLEFELKSKLIRLRSRYMALHAEPKALQGLMLESRTGFLVLFRALLRLFNDPVPASKSVALSCLAVKWNLDVSVFEELENLDMETPLPAEKTEAFFRRYLALIESVASHVNGV